MKMIYVVYDCGVDGRAQPKVLASFETEQAAKEFYNSTYNIIKEMFVYSNLKDYNENNPSALIEKALAKLTPEDKKVLGLTGFK